MMLNQKLSGLKMRESNSGELEENFGKKMCVKERKNKKTMTKKCLLERVLDFSYFLSINTYSLLM